MHRHRSRERWLPSSSQKSWWMSEPASLLMKWSLVTISPPLDASTLSSKAAETLEPQIKPPHCRNVSVSFGVLCERTWPLCFSLFLNLSHVILAVPITRYQSSVLLWILLSLWPQQCLWEGPFASSCAIYSYFTFYLFKGLALQVHSWSLLEIATVNIIA